MAEINKIKIGEIEYELHAMSADTLDGKHADEFVSQDDIRDLISNMPDKIYKQNEEPTDPVEGSLWIDMDEEGGGSSGSSGVTEADLLALDEKIQTAQLTADNAMIAAGNAEINAKAYTDTLTGEKTITRAKLADDALYSPVINISTAENFLTADMNGKTLMCRVSNADFSLTISKEVFDTLPVGFEVALVYWNVANSVKIYFTGGIYACIAGEGSIENATIALPERFTMVALKKVTSQSWLVTGNVEVV